MMNIHGRVIRDPSIPKPKLASALGKPLLTTNDSPDSSPYTHTDVVCMLVFSRVK
jgi:hypothetical protein